MPILQRSRPDLGFVDCRTQVLHSGLHRVILGYQLVSLL